MREGGGIAARRQAAGRGRAMAFLRSTSPADGEAELHGKQVLLRHPAMGDYQAWAELRARSRPASDRLGAAMGARRAVALGLPPAPAPVSARDEGGPGLRLPHLPPGRRDAGRGPQHQQCAARRRAGGLGRLLDRRPPCRPRPHDRWRQGHVAFRLRHARAAPAGGGMPAAQRRLHARAGEGRLQARRHGAPLPQDQRHLAGPRSLRPAARRCAGA